MDYRELDVGPVTRITGHRAAEMGGQRISPFGLIAAQRLECGDATIVFLE